MHGVQQTIRVALFAAALVAVLDVSFGDSRLPLMCKNIARDVIINSCKGPRIKRGVHIPNQETLGKELLIDVSALEEDLQAIRQKRQWGTVPGLTGGSVNTYHNTELNTPLLNFDDNRETSIGVHQFGPSNGFMPYGPAMGPAMGPLMGPLMGPAMGPAMGPGMFDGFRYSEPHEFLGYDLSPEELDELHEEFSERMPRNSKDLNKKIFLNVAAKCCPNVKLCYDDPSLIPCMGY